MNWVSALIERVSIRLTTADVNGTEALARIIVGVFGYTGEERSHRSVLISLTRPATGLEDLLVEVEGVDLEEVVFDLGESAEEVATAALFIAAIPEGECPATGGIVGGGIGLNSTHVCESGIRCAGQNWPLHC